MHSQNQENIENAITLQNYQQLQNLNRQVLQERIFNKQQILDQCVQDQSHFQYEHQESCQQQSLEIAQNQTKLGDQEIREIKQKLKVIFTFYSSFGDRMNIKYLKSNKFHKLMFDSGVKDSELNQKKLDLLFVKENKHKPNMEYTTFLNLLSKIAVEKFPQLKIQEALQKLIQDYLLPLYQNIMEETDLGDDLKKFRETIDAASLLLVKQVSGVLQKIYLVNKLLLKGCLNNFQAYFPWEPRNSESIEQTVHRSEQALFLLLKEYDICPNLITKSTAFLLFSEILETPLESLTWNQQIDNLIPYMKDRGVQFTLSRFFAYLIRCAFIANSNVLPMNTYLQQC